MITLTHGSSTATISPYGGQVMSYIKEGRDLLWQTEPHFLTQAQTDNRALRGGIPVCWPWFNKYNANPAAPSHGFARTSLWEVTAQTANTAILTLSTDGTNPFFPHSAKAQLTVALTDNLSVTLTTTNTGPTPFQLTTALHTYLRVEDIHETHVLGLGNLEHEGIAPTPFPADFTLTEEVDTIFQNVPWPVKILSSSHHHLISSSSPEAVLWNPWIEKSKSLDMPPAGYLNFLCLEAATIKTAPTLQPGQTHTLTTLIS